MERHWNATDSMPLLCVLLKTTQCSKNVNRGKKKFHTNSGCGEILHSVIKNF